MAPGKGSGRELSILLSCEGHCQLQTETSPRRQQAFDMLHPCPPPSGSCTSLPRTLTSFPLARPRPAKHGLHRPRTHPSTRLRLRDPNDARGVDQ